MTAPRDAPAGPVLGDEVEHAFWRAVRKAQHGGGQPTIPLTYEAVSVGLTAVVDVLATAPVQSLDGTALAEITAPTDSESGDAAYNPDVWELRRRLDLLIADRAALLSSAREEGVAAEREPAIDAAHLARQREWSRATFGPGPRTLGVLDHIRKELREIEADPLDLGEWVDVVILALDGAWRAGWEPQAIIDAIRVKQARNEARVWPDWRGASEDVAIEHDRSVPS